MHLITVQTAINCLVSCNPKPESFVYLRNYSYFGAVHADWTCTQELANS